MMELFIYSDSEAVRELFRGINRSKHYRTTFLPREELREAAFCTMDGVLIYLDLSGHDRRSFRKEIRFLASHGCAWGVADPDGIVDDPAELFHLGASDYLSPVQMKERIKTARIHRVVEFRGEILETERESSELSSEYLPQGVQLIPSGTDWSAVRKGQEYTFFFLYIELLPGEEWKVKSGDQNRQDIQARFEQFVRRRVTSANGEIWMWSEWGGVVLFPFNGNNSTPVIAATRMMLNRPLISLEEIRVDSLVDYRIALHVGNTVYNKRGDTGTIISDDVNFLFHLGKRRTEENSLYVTEAAYSQIPPRMRPLFSSIENFEGRMLYRMRRFVF